MKHFKIALKTSAPDHAAAELITYVYKPFFLILEFRNCPDRAEIPKKWKTKSKSNIKSWEPKKRASEKED